MMRIILNVCPFHYTRSNEIIVALDPPEFVNQKVGREIPFCMYSVLYVVSFFSFLLFYSTLLSCDFSRFPSNGVYIAQLIARYCNSVFDFH